MRRIEEIKWTATDVYLIFGLNAELCAVVEVYAFDDGEEKFVSDVLGSGTKVVMLDRFDEAI